MQAASLFDGFSFGGAITIVGDADLPWAVAGALDGVGAVDVVIH